MNRLRVVLLDDEVLIRKLIRMKLNTEELGLEIVGEFSSADSVIRQLPALRPDIIISDICMPGIDGISFSEQCVKALPDIKIIILTGYSDFDYARRSLKAGVCDYLMKPIQTEELNTSVARAARKIREEKERQESHRRMLLEREQNIPLLRSTYINRLLTGGEEDADIREKLLEYGIRMAAGYEETVQLGVISVQEGLNDPESLTLVRKEAERFFEDEEDFYVVQDPWGRIVMLKCGENSSFRECAALLMELLAEKFPYHFGWGYSEKKILLEGIKDLYTRAIEDMCQRRDVQKSVQSACQYRFYSSEERKSVIEDMKEGNVELAVIDAEQLLEFAQKEAEIPVFTAQGARAMLEDLAAAVGRQDEAEKYTKRLGWCRCAEDIGRCFLGITAQLAMLQAMELEGEKGRLMGEILAFLQENLNHPDMNMNWLTTRFGISGSLLGRMFKRFTAKSYSEYLSELRFWKMLQLLKTDAGMLDRDIGSEIGITDSHYLSIWFRKMTGYSVTEYRKMKVIEK